jgi:hypothetical protein
MTEEEAARDTKASELLINLALATDALCDFYGDNGKITVFHSKYLIAITEKLDKLKISLIGKVRGESK